MLTWHAFVLFIVSILRILLLFFINFYVYVYRVFIKMSGIFTRLVLFTKIIKTVCTCIYPIILSFAVISNFIFHNKTQVRNAY